MNKVPELSRGLRFGLTDDGAKSKVRVVVDGIGQQKLERLGIRIDSPK